MKVALYARVSSDRQDVDLSITAQLKALREYASRNGYTVVKEYIDEAESGRSIDRPGFQNMIATARQKLTPFEAILVWKLSRFARNREDSIIYKSLLRKHGIQVISINEPVEDTPSGKLLEGIIEVIDEFYSANLSQDVLRGQRENASRGFYNGGRPPYGYVRVKVKDGTTSRTKLEPDPKTAPITQRIFRERLTGKGLKAIARSLNGDGISSGTGKNGEQPRSRKYFIMKPTPGQWYGASGRRIRARLSMVLLSCGLREPGPLLLTEQHSHRHRQGWLPEHPRLFILGR